MSLEGCACWGAHAGSDAAPMTCECRERLLWPGPQFRRGFTCGRVIGLAGRERKLRCLYNISVQSQPRWCQVNEQTLTNSIQTLKQTNGQQHKKRGVPKSRRKLCMRGVIILPNILHRRLVGRWSRLGLLFFQLCHLCIIGHGERINKG